MNNEDDDKTAFADAIGMLKGAPEMLKRCPVGAVACLVMLAPDADTENLGIYLTAQGARDLAQWLLERSQGGLA